MSDPESSDKPFDPLEGYEEKYKGPVILITDNERGLGALKAKLIESLKMADCQVIMIDSCAELEEHPTRKQIKDLYFGFAQLNPNTERTTAFNSNSNILAAKHLSGSTKPKKDRKARKKVSYPGSGHY